ncbi:MAG: gamma-glutamyltransferase family protein [Oscillospiraceae bacterium]|nr:gamma-glutamyltransferase family protein [Oscillospiraceae bacterium]
MPNETLFSPSPKGPFDPLAQRYASQRFPVYARGGMVNCSSPQAAAAGLEILRRGGNAVDAAVAAAAALTVVEPTANGLGSDAFALVWSEKERRLFGLNASGPAPMLASAERVIADGFAQDGRMPRHGWAPVTVPGAVGAWAALNGRFGRLTLSETLAPAVDYAENGYPCAPNLAAVWRRAFEIYSRRLRGAVFEPWFRCFAPDGRTPRAGELVRLPDHAATLRSIGESRGESFYRGETARKIDAASRADGGYLRFEDLAAYEPSWVEPLRLSYRGCEVCEIPPNGQGIVALLALNILRNFEPGDREDPETCHRQIEAVKMAFADALKVVTDPREMAVDPQSLLDPAYGAALAEKMSGRAQVWTSALPPKSGTVYLCCADGEGNMVSYIQSNYMGFGSGIVVDGTGVALQNRGSDFSLNPADANVLRPGKRSYHTIIPGFLMKDGAPLGPFGVMGGYMQPQGHVQVVTNLLDFGMDPQQALDAPRWQWMRDGRLTVETRFPAPLARALEERGHELSVDPDTTSFGRGQIILRQPNGVLVGGTESRTDSNIACW